jgi:hypothetical protein
MLAVGATAGWLAAARWQGIESVRRVDVAATSVRDQGGATEFVASTDYEWTRLRLALPAGGSATDVFRIALRSAAGASASPLWIRDAIATNDSSGRSVTIDVPSRLLAPGGYFVSVSRRTTQAPEPVLETAIVVR